ncbi:MAG: aspartate--tRNA ligase [Longimicrobiaceae bacterium]
MTDAATAFRSHYAGLLRPADAGRSVRLAGWVHRSRDLGKLVFLDLRDRTGLVQLSFDPARAGEEVAAGARELGAEDVVLVEGRVEKRPEPNPELATGAVEVRVTSLRLLSRAEPPPIPVYRAPDEEPPSEELQLQYRHLDLRRPEMQRNLVLRHQAARIVRRSLSEQGFLEIETPLLTRPTPEGARDYLVPSRVHPGEFYALPQSPQLYKQLLMVSGFDRYFQMARCLRDEDLRADRQPEFTQIDAEMSFVDEEDVFRAAETMISAVWRELLGVTLELPFPRLSYAEALGRYGTDKPDLRYGLEIVDLTETLREADFLLFQRTRNTGERIRGIRVPGGAKLSRKELDGLQEVARRAGVAGALWVKLGEHGFSGTFAKALTGGVGELLRSATWMEPGDLFVATVGACAGEGGEVGMEPALDALRQHLAGRLKLVESGRHEWLWVTGFPMFEWQSEKSRLGALHHPFTAPHPDDSERLLAAAREGNAPGSGKARRLAGAAVRSRAYDAVYNGHELASGSVRIHDAALQRAVFTLLGVAPREAQARFGFLLDALRHGTPPHAGFAFGFDRMVMLLAGARSLREVIAFPKSTAARAVFEGAPARVPEEELAELHLGTVTDA